MKLSKQHIKTILDKLESVYPLMLGSDGYRELVASIGDDITLDAHLLYLYEKGLIETEMKYAPHVPGWRVTAHLTRINSNGIDALANANP
ncbi:hypothetical protein NB694_000487 [Pantoea ananatis]|uniref:hypothetical protein n=1 Tax=Pantoea ananas TaxID=553 RepID=UPI0021F75801|nr:hypothetical protein [Pantoea ananatis]MCW0310687.1 hypothetical protein [Pantoea ananatis]